MTKEELCRMCDNYSTENECENKDDCKLQAILTENEQLKKQIAELKASISW